MGDLIIGIAISEVVRIGAFVTCEDDPRRQQAVDGEAREGLRYRFWRGGDPPISLRF